MSQDQVPGKAASILQLSCPRCRRAKLFKTPTFSFKQPFDMKGHCDLCGQDFMPEPGFYYGAMFLSYIFMAWFCISFIALFHWVLGWSTNGSFALLLAVCAIFYVYIFRLARSAWIGFNVKYDPKALTKG
jgi:uncharacterized protein (DUF983 family)